MKKLGACQFIEVESVEILAFLHPMQISEVRIFYITVNYFESLKLGLRCQRLKYGSLLCTAIKLDRIQLELSETLSL